MLSTTEAKLEFFVSEKNHFLVISLLGTLTKTTLPVLEKIQDELAQRDAKLIVLNCYDLHRVEVGGVPGIVRLQKMIRDRPSTHLRICFLKPDISKFLMESGAVRPNELCNNLLEALKDLTPLVPG
jgi:anti-anti-sigma regulatory factor